MNNPKTFIKSIIGCASAGIASLVTATASAPAAGQSDITLNEGLVAAGAALTAFALVYFIPNKES